MSAPPIRLVLATANPDKVEEISAILGDVADGSFELIARPAHVPEVDETGETLEENARLKARALVAATGLPAVADDTGLEIHALGGAPGVYAARYAGEDATYAQNVAKVLDDLHALGAESPVDRRARFRTVALVAYPDGHELVADGVVEGSIVEVGRGDGGFGYDPVFAPDDAPGLTFAEMTPADKHAISHRGRAFRALAVLLADGLA